MKAKKAISLLLALVMALGCMSVSAWATGETMTEQALRDAINSASDGDTVTLTGNVDLTYRLLIDKSLTLDLGGYTISRELANSSGAGPDGTTATPNTYLLHVSSGEVTIKNGTISYNLANYSGSSGETYANTIRVGYGYNGSKGDCTLTLKDMNVHADFKSSKKQAMVYVDSGTLNVVDSVFTATGAGTSSSYQKTLIYVNSDAKAEKADVNIQGRSQINGGSLGYLCAIWIQGSGDAAPAAVRDHVVIDGESVTVTATGTSSKAVEIPNYGECTIRSGKISGQLWAQKADRYIEVSGGYFSHPMGTASTSNKIMLAEGKCYSLNDDPTYKYVVGAKPESVSAVEAVDATCDVNGNIAYWTDSEGKCYSDETGTVEITLESTIIPSGHVWDNGTWEWAGDCSSATATFTCSRGGHSTEAIEATVTHSAATFGGDPSNYKATVMLDGVQKTKSKASVADAIIGNTQYSKLMDAFGEAADGDTVTVLTDVEKLGYVVTKALTVDLNGHSISGPSNYTNNGRSKSYVFDVQAGGKLTIEDSAGGGVVQTTKSSSVFQKANGATITITGGTFNSDPTSYVDTSTYSVTNNNNGTWTVGEAAATTYVAQVGTTDNAPKYETLADAISHATSGDTIKLLADIADAGSINLPAGVTLDGSLKSDGNYTISGNSAVYINAAGGTVQNVNFADIHNNKNQLTPIYGNALIGTATVTGCSFNNTDWDMIQITPVAGATINITNNTFNTFTGENVRRYIHIQSGVNVDFTATITGNKMYSPANLMYTGIEVFFPADWSKVTISNNYIANPIGVCLIGPQYNQENNAYAQALNGFVTEDGSQAVTIKASVASGAANDYDRFLFPTVEDAVEWAVANYKGVVTLEADATLSSMITLTKNLTVKLNGHTLTAFGTIPGSWIRVLDDATLTVDGTTSGSTVNGRIDLGVATNNNGSVVLNGGTYIRNNGTVLHINGTCLSSNVTINNATLTSIGDNGIQLNGKGTFVISNSTITGATGVYIKSGDLTITNSTITGNKTPVNYSYNGNGADATGDAIVIDNCAYPGGAPTVKLGAVNTISGTKGQVGYYEAKTTDSNWSNASVLATTQYTLSTNTEKGWTTNTDGATSATYPYTIGEDPTITYVAKIGEAKYETLAAAVTAATNDQTIELLEDITLDAYVAVNKTITLDLKGHSITRPNDSGNTALLVTGNLTVTDTADNSTAAIVASTFPIYVNGGTLTVNSGIVGSEHSAYGIFDNGTATINGGAIYGVTYGVCAAGDATLTVSGGAIAATGEDSYGIFGQNTSTVNVSGSASIFATGWGIAMAGTSTLNVTGGTISSNSIGISTNGNAGQNATVTISGGAITGTGLGVYQPSGVLSISGGTITGATGVYFKSNSLSITDGTIIGNGDHADYNYNGNGANPTGDALVIDSCGYPNGIDNVYVSGGTFTSAYAKPVACYTYQENTPVTKFITGGTFGGTYDAEAYADYIATGYQNSNVTNGWTVEIVTGQFEEVKETTNKTQAVATTVVDNGNETSTTFSFASTTNDEDVSYAIRTSTAPTSNPTYETVNYTPVDTDVKTTATTAIDDGKVDKTDVGSATSQQIVAAEVKLTSDATKVQSNVKVSSGAVTNILKTQAAARAITEAASQVADQSSIKAVEVQLQTKLTGYTLSADATDGAVASKVIYDVTPVAVVKDAKGDIIQANEADIAVRLDNNDLAAQNLVLAFTLPVPADLVNKDHMFVNVTHHDTTEMYPIQGNSTDGYYVELTSDKFSEFELTPITIGVFEHATYGFAIELRDSININFKIKNPTAAIDNYKVVSRFNDVETVWNAPSSTNGTEYTYVVAACAARQMTKLAEIEVYYKDSTGWVLDATYTGDGALSIQKYCNMIIAGDNSEYVENVCRAVLDYGSEAQKVFDKEESLEKLANGGVEQLMNKTPVPATTSTYINGTVMFSLSMKAFTQFNLYFGIGDLTSSFGTDDAISKGYSVSVFDVTSNGNVSREVGKYTFDYTNGYPRVIITGITPNQLDSEVRVVVYKNSTEYAVYQGSPIAYMYSVMQNSGSTQKDMITALYNYHLIVKEWLSNQ